MSKRIYIVFECRGGRVTSLHETWKEAKEMCLPLHNMCTSYKLGQDYSCYPDKGPTIKSGF